MLKALVSVRDEILAKCGHGDITLEIVTKVFVGLTVVDFIVFVRYVTPADNPILGEFTRWSRQPGVYTAAETIVEIRYADHLSEPWRRFVVCKELCHSLETNSGSHTATNAAMSSLVDAFSILSSAGASAPAIGAALGTELVAEAGAIELLCPLPKRKAIIATGVTMDDATCARLAAEFNVPEMYMKMAFDPKYVQVVEWLFENG
jgi:hypothetical protein